MLLSESYRILVGLLRSLVFVYWNIAASYANQFTAAADCLIALVYDSTHTATLDSSSDAFHVSGFVCVLVCLSAILQAQFTKFAWRVLRESSKKPNLRPRNYFIIWAIAPLFLMGFWLVARKTLVGLVLWCL
jgi:hypothetical protein